MRVITAVDQVATQYPPDGELHSSGIKQDNNSGEDYRTLMSLKKSNPYPTVTATLVLVESPLNVHYFHREN